MDRPLRVFVSSTAQDLGEFRRAAREEILLAGWTPVAMEPFGETGIGPTVTECRTGVSSCDLVVLLLAHRWGWVPDASQGGDGRRSITAWEFEEAVRRDIPVLAFLADEDWPGRLWESSDEGRARVREFRAGVNRPAAGFAFERDPGASGSAFRLLVRRELLRHRAELERRRRESAPSPSVRADRPAASPARTATPVRNDVIDFRVERQRHRGLCGRTEVLDRMETWLGDAVHAPSWLVVVGMPGVGKTALLSGCLDRLEARGHRVPHHFVRRHRGTWDRPEAMARSLAAQVQELFPEHARPDVPPEDRLLEVLGLVSERALVPSGRHLHLLIDGLEELADERGPEFAVRTYLPHALPPNVHVICSTRRHPPLLEWLLERDGVRVLDLDAQVGSNRSACEEWWRDHAGDFRPPLPATLVQEAVRRAEGNLLYTVMLGQWLRSAAPAERRVDRIPVGLNGFLQQAWRRVSEAPSRVRTTLVEGLAIVCAARESLPLTLLAHVAGWERAEERRAFLDATRPLLLEEPVPGQDDSAFRPFHESFRQFVLREALTPGETLAAHRRLAERLARWPVRPEGTEVERSYALRHAVWHRLECGEPSAAVALVRDAGYLRDACVGTGVAALEDAVQAAEARAAGLEDAAVLPAILRALRQESHWLRRDPGALPSILYNRLLCMGLDPVAAIRFEGAASPQGFPRLRWPLEGGNAQALRTLEGHAREVVALASSPPFLASASLDGTVRVWRLPDGQTHRSWEAPAPGVGCLCALADGGFGIGLADGRVALWSRDAAEPVPFPAHALSVHGLVANGPDEVLSGGGDGFVRAWRGPAPAAPAREWRVADPADRPVVSIAVLADGRFVTSTGRSASPGSWDPGSRAGSTVFEACDAPVVCVAALPNGHVVGASATGTLCEWAPATGGIVRTVASPGDIVLCLAPLADGRVACGLADGRIRILDLRSSTASLVLRAHDRDCLALAGLPDGSLASASADRSIRIWDVTAERPSVAAFEAPRRPLALCPIGSDRVAVAMTDGSVRIQDLRTARPSATLIGHADQVRCVDRLHDGRLVTGSADGEIRIWDLTEGGRLTGRFRHGRVEEDRRVAVNSLAVLRDGGLASGGADGDLRIWDARDPRSDPASPTSSDAGTFWLRQVTAAHSGEVLSLVALPDGGLASGGSDGRVLLWESDGRRGFRVVGTHDDQVRALATLPGGRIASGSDDRTIRVWEVSEGPRLARVLRGHDAWICGLTALPDGRLASVSADRTVRIWDPDSDHAPVVVHGQAYFLCVAWGSGGLVAGDRNDAIWVLDVPIPRAHAREAHVGVPAPA